MQSMQRSIWSNTWRWLITERSLCRLCWLSSLVKIFWSSQMQANDSKFRLASRACTSHRSEFLPLVAMQTDTSITKGQVWWLYLDSNDKTSKTCESSLKILVDSFRPVFSVTNRKRWWFSLMKSNMITPLSWFPMIREEVLSFTANDVYQSEMNRCKKIEGRKGDTNCIWQRHNQIDRTVFACMDQRGSSTLGWSSWITLLLSCCQDFDQDAILSLWRDKHV